MAFILVKGPSANLDEVYAQIQNRGFSMQYLNMDICFPPHEAKIISPYVLGWSQERFRPETATHPCIVCIYDPYDCYPLADKKFITSSKMFFDDSRFVEHFTARTIFNELRLNTCAIMPKHPMTIKEVQSGPIPSGLTCVDCKKVIDGPYFTAPSWDLCEMVRCMQCQHGIGRATIHGPSEVLVPESPIAKFLLEHMAHSFNVDVLLLPHSWLTIFLIGERYYISYVPIPATVHNRLYKDRQRLRMTPKVVDHLFFAPKEHTKKKHPINVQALFNEFVSDLK